MSIGTGAFSSVEAERGVEVNVVDDKNAYLGLDVEDEAVTVGKLTDVATITNSFADRLSLDITIEQRDAVIDEIAVGGEAPDNGFSLGLGPGKDAVIAVTCSQTGAASFKLRFEGQTNGASVDKVRSFEIDCESETDSVVSGVTFKPGNSGIVINGNGATTDASVYYESKGGSGVEQSKTCNVPMEETLKLNQNFDGPSNGGEIVGVAVGGSDGVFVHQDFDDCEVPNSSGGDVEVTEEAASGFFDQCLVN
ncbi:hypothetical protein [Halorubrum sp. FL23]|uniref:hypothetical protein n=1 Tax=Halorubrum sp. FL23 TaxID=3458704 RepID=UPI004034A0C1